MIYSRSYFKINNIRLTIDRDIVYKSINYLRISPYSIRDNLNVVEIKFQITYKYLLHVGLQLTVRNNKLRPFVFFRSSSEIMSLYWSGALEDKNSALSVSNVLIIAYFDIICCWIKM